LNDQVTQEANMSHFLSQCWRMMSHPARRTPAPDAHAGNAGRDRVTDRVTRAEQLADIAVYARTGYFDIGHTAEGFETPRH
jgi:hypothetical protein